MADNRDVLTEDELDALAEGVANGDVRVEGDNGNSMAGISLYDFHQPAHLLKARLPAMELINERFCKDHEASLFSLLQRVVDIEPDEIQMLKFSDFLNSLPASTSVSRVRVNELNGSMLITMDSSIVYLFVDCFFGGTGTASSVDNEREFTATEKRIIERVLELAFKDLTNAWSGVSKLSFSFMYAENRMQMIGAAESSEVVVLSKFKLKINNTEGELNLVMPHGLLEPIRPLLASGVKKGHADSDENWRYNLQRKLEEVEIDINAIFAQADISLGELLSLKAADFIPVNMSETTLVYSEEVPLFEGKIGMSNQQAAVRVGPLHHH